MFKGHKDKARSMDWASAILLPNARTADTLQGLSTGMSCKAPCRWNQCRSSSKIWHSTNICSAASRNGRRLSKQQIVVCKASIADPKARYHDLLLPEGGEEGHSYYHDLPATSSEAGRSVLPEECLPDCNAGRLVLLSIHVEQSSLFAYDSAQSNFPDGMEKWSIYE